MLRPFPLLRFFPALCGIAVLAFPPFAQATLSIDLWTGGSGDWFDSGNWDDGTLPELVETMDAMGNLISSDADGLLIDNGGTAILSLPYFTAGVANASTEAILGDANSGYLRLENGAYLVMKDYGPQIASPDFILGNQAGAAGGITVTGQSSMLDVTYSPASNAQMIIGNAGSGELTVEDQGSAALGANVVLGKLAGSSGSITVGGNGSSLHADNLIVGESGAGSVNLSGGLAQGVSWILAKNVGSTGTVSVSGPGSPGYSSNLLLDSVVIGESGSANLTVENYSHLQNDSLATIGALAGSVGWVNVKTDADWVSHPGLIVGDAGQGTLLIEGSGRVEFDHPGSSLIVGNQAGSVGEVIATGMGPTWNLSAKGDLVLGNAGTGTLTVADRARVVAGNGGGTLELGHGGTGAGILNLGTGAAPGSVSVAVVHGGAGQAIVNFNHNYTPANSAAGTSYNDHYEFTPRLTGSVKVNHLAGTTVFLGSSTYTGATTISGGQLLLWNAPSVSPSYYAGKIGGTSSVVVETGAALALMGDQAVVDRINDAAALTLSGGTFFLNGLSEGTVSSAGLGMFNLLDTSTINFGNPLTAGILTFAGVGVHTDKAMLLIADWNGIMTLGGGTSQLLFAGNSSDFTSLYDQDEVQFYGYNLGYLTVQGAGFYEVVPFAVPEPGTAGLLLLGGLGLWLARRHSRA